MHRQPEKHAPERLPDPWLFDSERLLRELARCRELVLQIPATTHATHFSANIAIDAIWNLEETLRHLLHLHREGQRQFAKKAQVPARKVEISAGSKPRVLPTKKAARGGNT